MNSELVITNNSEERISIKADGERFIIAEENDKTLGCMPRQFNTIELSYAQMSELITFAKGEIIRRMMEEK